MRRSLGNLGGDIDTSGDEESADLLAEALRVESTMDADAPDRAHVHGFHAYPARAHPFTARRLVESFSGEGATILDPFCGSGTVLVEAMLANRAAIGTDLNPFAVMLARAKTFPRTHAKGQALIEAARGVAAFADERRKAKAGATRRLPREDLAVFQPHVVLELDSLRAGIAKAPPETRPELGLVLSAILVKTSTRRGDTAAEGDAEKRIAAGYPARLFVRKAEELAARFQAFAELLPSPPPRARVFLDDATVLDHVEDASIDAVVTSPPYVNTYDYLQHHDLRMRWLDLDRRPLASHELGARRNYEKLRPREAQAAWAGELARFFAALARVTRKEAPIVILIADSAVGGEAIRADAIVADVASRGGELLPVARASQARPHFHGPTAAAFQTQARAEHALLLRKR